MSRRVDFSSRSLKFLAGNHVSEDFVLAEIEMALRKFQGEDINHIIACQTGGGQAGSSSQTKKFILLKRSFFNQHK